MYAAFARCNDRMCTSEDVHCRAYGYGVPYKIERTYRNQYTGKGACGLPVHTIAGEALASLGVSDTPGVVSHVRVKAVDPDTGLATAFTVTGSTTLGLTGTVRAANSDYYSVVDGVREGLAQVSTHVRCTLATGVWGEQATRKGQMWQRGNVEREWLLREETCQPRRFDEHGEVFKRTQRSAATWHP